MKKIISTMLLSVLTLATLFASGTKEGAVGKAAMKEPIKIGISKMVSHPALDAIEQGIQDSINKSGKDVVFDLQNCNAEMSTAISIAQLFKSEKKDIVLGIATPPAQALASVYNNSNTPVIFAAITDPDAAGLTYAKGEATNVCGVSDLNPITLQIEYFVKVTKLKRLGMVYTSGEANGVAMMERAKKYCEANGIEFVGAAVSNSSEVKSAALSIVDRIDGMFIANDNTVVSALASIDQVCSEYNLPLFNSDVTSSDNTNFLMSWGLDYYKVGLLCGDVALQIINGDKPKDIGAIYLTDIKQFQLYLNLDRAKELGFTFPKEILDAASLLVKNGKIIEK
ncbi:MAG: ABC transporter substrate-binding protein [Spirochaetaceae bacterium]|nr:ABC transporter substrate-binding protein [Spirochaetaceae bacterium]